jgi:hypothetical protein
VRRLPGIRGIPALVAAVVAASCGGPGSAPTSTTSSAPTSPPIVSSATPSGPPTLEDVCGSEGSGAQTFLFHTSDGEQLFGAILGSGSTGVVMANDEPHPLCEELREARFLARHGVRVLLFDCRGHGESDPPAGDAGRLDLDVAGAVGALRETGARRIFVLGAYAGGSLALVASTEVRPAVSGVIAVSAAPRRGEWVNGPYTGPGAFAIASRVRVPVLLLAVRTDRFVPLREDRRLLGRLHAESKRLLVFPSGLGGWDLFDLNTFSDRANRSVLEFLDHRSSPGM